MEQNKQQRLAVLDILIASLSLFILTALTIDTFVKLSSETSILLEYIDNIICTIFIFEFAIRFNKAPSKIYFLKWNWIDLVSSIPMIDAFRYGRTFRLIRILRIIRAFRSTKKLLTFMFKNRIQGTLASVSTITILMIFFAAIAILQVETNPKSNIKSAEDAIWWAFTTVSTVGYGDKYPVTLEGRLIAVVLIITGLGLFGTFTGFVTSWFMGNKKTE
jgi:voltage-gated potassium channel